MGVRGKRCDVTPSEIMELRKQGYSNHDIAAMLDIGRNTVYRAIGAQGKHMGRMAAFADKPTKKAEKAEEPSPKVEVYKPQAISEEYSIGTEGEEINVKIDHIAETICVTTLGGDICISYEQARGLVQFLAWASREKCKEVADS